MPMEEVPPLPPPADPPPAIDPSSETVAMMLAPIHSYGHKEPVEVCRAEFESTVRDALEDFPTEEVVEDMTRELDMVKSFPMYQTLPQAEAPGTVWSGRWCCRREEPQASESSVCSAAIRNLSWCCFLQFHSWARGHESFVCHCSVERHHCLVTFGVAFINTPKHVGEPVLVEPPQGLYENNNKVWCHKKGIERFEERITTLPRRLRRRTHISTWFRTFRRIANTLRGPCAQHVHCSACRWFDRGRLELPVE